MKNMKKSYLSAKSNVQSRERSLFSTSIHFLALQNGLRNCVCRHYYKKIISGYLIVVEVLFVVYHLLEADLNLKLKGCLRK